MKIFAKKSLGQNFLHDLSVIKDIVSAGKVKIGDLILEVGPGKGVLTKKLLESGAKVIAVEKDDRLIDVLSETFKKELEEKRLKIVHADILKTSIKDLVGEESYKLIANIPYYITGALFEKVLEKDKLPEQIVVLIQKEVAERIVARDLKESILSLSVKAYGEPKIVRKVGKGAFNPPPKVDSAVLSIENISKKFFDEFSEKEFFQWIRAGFSSKRKKLIRNLEKVSSKESLEKIFEKVRLDQNIRAEALGPNDWKNIIVNSK